MSERSSSAAVHRTTLAAGVGLVVTVAVVFVPSLRFAYRSLEGHLVVETAVTLIAALAALLLYGRYRRGRLLADLVLVYAMALLSVAAFVLVTLPAVFGAGVGVATTNWAAVVIRFVGAVMIVVAALLPDRQVHDPSRPVLEVTGAVVVFGGIVLAVVVLAAGLPEAVEVEFVPEQSARPTLQGHPLVLAVQVANLVCYTVASFAFTRRGARRGDELLSWFGAAAALGAWSRGHYLLFPSLYTEWLYVGDLLRLGFYVLLLVGAVREIQHYWSTQALAAAESERRRLARDLHDGVVQELGYIRSVAARARTAVGDDADRIIAAADRASDESRRSLSALTAAPDEPLATTLQRSVSEVGDRYDVPVHFSVDGAVDVSPDLREAILRIVREAVANAARHAEAAAVSVSLTSGEVRVQDDGKGFCPEARSRAGSFGLISMRERAEAMGGVLEIASAPGEGTTVRVTW